MIEVAPAPTAWLIAIPNYNPPKVNDWRGWHWTKRAAPKAELADLLKVYALAANVPPADRFGREHKRKIGLTVYGWPRGRLPDPDAFLKDLLDALKTAGLLVDDSQEFCSFTQPVVVRSKVRRTEVTIEEVT